MLTSYMLRIFVASCNKSLFYVDAWVGMKCFAYVKGTRKSKRKRILRSDIVKCVDILLNVFVVIICREKTILLINR